MPTTSPPEYTSLMPRPQWQNGSDVSTYGQRRVKSGIDEIKATDINSLRESVDLIWSHTHEYHDSVGSC